MEYGMSVRLPVRFADAVPRVRAALAEHEGVDLGLRVTVVVQRRHLHLLILVGHPSDAAELQEIVDFYESPVGRKLVAANTTLNESLQTVMGVFETNLKTEFFAKVRAELRDAGHDI